MTKIALSGASGQVGTVIRRRFHERGVPLRSAGGRRALEPLFEGEDVLHGDLRDPVVVDRLLAGTEFLIHMAGTSVERPLPEIIDNNLTGLVAIYEGMRRNKVRRILFASSNHAIGMYPVTEKLSLDCQPRPDGFYGLSKVWGEALARLYWDKHGIETLSVRIGSCLAKPTEPRHLATWFGHEDLMHMLDRFVEAEDIGGFLVVWGVSANTRSWWDNSGGADKLGYQPKQNAEDYAEQILAGPNPLDPIGRRFQGGSFASVDYGRGNAPPGD